MLLIGQYFVALCVVELRDKRRLTSFVARTLPALNRAASWKGNLYTDSIPVEDEKRIYSITVWQTEEVYKEFTECEEYQSSLRVVQSVAVSAKCLHIGANEIPKWNIIEELLREQGKEVPIKNKKRKTFAERLHLTRRKESLLP